MIKHKFKSELLIEFESLADGALSNIMLPPTGMMLGTKLELQSNNWFILVFRVDHGYKILRVLIKRLNDLKASEPVEAVLETKNTFPHDLLSKCSFNICPENFILKEVSVEYRIIETYVDLSLIHI